MINKKTVLSIIVTLAITGTSLANANTCLENITNNVNKLDADFQFTADQKIEIPKIRCANYQQESKLDKEMKQVLDQKRELIKQKDVDKNQLQNLINQEASIFSEIQTNIFNMRHDIYQLLDNKQRVIYINKLPSLERNY